jgi:hypothetical protein
MPRFLSHFYHSFTFLHSKIVRFVFLLKKDIFRSLSHFYHSFTFPHSKIVRFVFLLKKDIFRFLSHFYHSFTFSHSKIVRKEISTVFLLSLLVVFSVGNLFSFLRFLTVFNLFKFFFKYVKFESKIDQFIYHSFYILISYFSLIFPFVYKCVF